MDGVKVYNKTPDELAQLILGPPGSMVDLVLRQGSIVKEISVKRARQQANDIGSTPTKLPSDLKLAYQIPMPTMQMQQVLAHDHRYVHPDPSRPMRNLSDSPPLLLPANSLPRTVHAMQDTQGLPHVDDRYFEMSTRPQRASDMPDISRISLHSQMPINRSKVTLSCFLRQQVAAPEDLPAGSRFCITVHDLQPTTRKLPAQSRPNGPDESKCDNMVVIVNPVGPDCVSSKQSLSSPPITRS